MEYHCDMRVTLDHLRAYAVARSLFKPTTLGKAIGKLGFVQADPIRAPARAQDLTLRHRVVGYRAGDLERRYPRLPIEEDYFVNYGYLLREHHRLIHAPMPPNARAPPASIPWSISSDPSTPPLPAAASRSSCASSAEVSRNGLSTAPSPS